MNGIPCKVSDGVHFKVVANACDPHCRITFSTSSAKVALNANQQPVARRVRKAAFCFFGVPQHRSIPCRTAQAGGDDSRAGPPEVPTEVQPAPVTQTLRLEASKAQVPPPEVPASSMRRCRRKISRFLHFRQCSRLCSRHGGVVLWTSRLRTSGPLGAFPVPERLHLRAAPPARQPSPKADLRKSRILGRNVEIR